MGAEHDAAIGGVEAGLDVEVQRPSVELRWQRQTRALRFQIVEYVFVRAFLYKGQRAERDALQVMTQQLGRGPLVNRASSTPGRR